MAAIELSSGAPPDGSPRRDELHLRLLDLRQPPRAEALLKCVLSPDEIERAGRFKLEADRSRFVLTRGWLRVTLARCLAVTPERLVFAYGAHGKPVLAGRYRDSELSFNVSHSSNHALLGLTIGRAIGVDIEQLRPMADFESMATGYFSATEAQAIMRVPDRDRLRAFFRCWTRKEAFIKISTTDLPGASHGNWTVTGLSLTPDCEAAAAVEGAAERISAWRDSISAGSPRTRDDAGTTRRERS
jgi:4'-phosphopantetheinyl transferase